MHLYAYVPPVSSYTLSIVEISMAIGAATSYLKRMMYYNLTIRVDAPCAPTSRTARHAGVLDVGCSEG